MLHKCYDMPTTDSWDRANKGFLAADNRPCPPPSLAMQHQQTMAGAPAPAAQFQNQQMGSARPHASFLKFNPFKAKSSPSKRQRNLSEADDGARSRSVPEVGEASSVPTDEQRMNQILSLQSFDGSWRDDKRLFEVLNLKKEDVQAFLGETERTTMATLLAVAFLEAKMATAEGVWEMVVDKAKGWLDARIGEVKRADRLSAIKKKIFAN